MSSPFSETFQHLRLCKGLRQKDLAELMGYEQSYVSALEIGIKGPPPIKFINQLIHILELTEAEKLKLLEAACLSGRRFWLPVDVPKDVYLLAHELWETIDQMHPRQVQMIRDILSMPMALAIHEVEPRRIRRKRKEAPKM